MQIIAFRTFKARIMVNFKSGVRDNSVPVGNPARRRPPAVHSLRPLFFKNAQTAHRQFIDLKRLETGLLDGETTDREAAYRQR